MRQTPGAQLQRLLTTIELQKDYLLRCDLGSDRRRIAEQHLAILLQRQDVIMRQLERSA